MQTLTLNAVTDGASPGLSILYLGSTDYRLLPIGKAHAELVWDAVTAVPQAGGAILVWFSCGEPAPLPSVPDAQPLEQPTTIPGQMEPVHWKFYGNSSQFCQDFVAVWNTCGGVRVYPADNPDQLRLTVRPHFFDTRDQRRLGIADFSEDSPQPAESQVEMSGLMDFIGSQVMSFATKLEDPDFREALMNPFQSESDVELVRKANVYVRKSGHDDEVHMEFLTSLARPDELFASLFKKHKLVCKTTQETRGKWG